MGIRETIELEVIGRGELRSVAGELDRIAKALKTINGQGGGAGAALSKQEFKIAQIRERTAGRVAEAQIKSALKLNELEKKQTGDLIVSLAKKRVAGEEARLAVSAKKAEAKETKKTARSEAQRAASTNRRAKAERRVATAQSKGAASAGVFSGNLMASLAESGARAALDLVVAGGRALYQAQAFREDVRGGLELILRSKSEADAIMRQSAETADKIGASRAQVSGMMLQLLTKGFDKQRSDEIVKRLADLSTVDPTANLDRLQLAITQIAGKGRLQGQELLQLAEAGLETTSVYDALSKQLGKSRKDIIKMQETGKISSEVAIRGILDAIAEQTGNKAAGQVSAEKSMRDLSGLMRRLEAIPSNVFFDLQVGPGVDGVKGAMRDIIEFFDAGSASGKEVRKVLGDTINAIVEGLTGIDPSKGTSIKDTLAAIVEVIKGSKDQIREFAAGVAAMGKAFAWVAGIAGSFASAKKSISDFFGFKPPSAVGFWTYLLTAGPRLALAALQALFPSFYAAGSQIINGLVSGITAGASAVINAITNTVKSGIAAAKSALGIASPSKVFAEMGTMIPMGMGVGITRTTGKAEAAAADMASRVIGGASGFAGPANGNAAAAPVAQGAAAQVAAGAAGATVIHINVTVNADDNADLGAIEDAARRGAIAGAREALMAGLAEVA